MVDHEHSNDKAKATVALDNVTKKLRELKLELESLGEIITGAPFAGRGGEMKDPGNLKP